MNAIVPIGRMDLHRERAQEAFDQGGRAVLAHRFDGARRPNCPYGGGAISGRYWRRGRDRMQMLLDQFEAVRP